MPLTEINVTKPNPVFDNYWRELEAARAAKPPPPPWPAVDPGLLEEGRRRLPAFPLTSGRSALRMSSAARSSAAGWATGYSIG